jgi:hypothetical protein
MKIPSTKLYLAVLLELSRAEKAVVNRHLVIAEKRKHHLKMMFLIVIGQQLREEVSYWSSQRNT